MVLSLSQILFADNRNKLSALANDRVEKEFSSQVRSDSFSFDRLLIALSLSLMFNKEKGKFYIRIEGRFESAHYLYKYYADGSDEACHGHSWKVEVFLSGKENIRPDGISFDFLTAKQKLAQLINSIDHILINDHPDFKGINPTSENIARWFYSGLKDEVKKAKGKVDRIIIHEGPENLAYFEPI